MVRREAMDGPDLGTMNPKAARSVSAPRGPTATKTAR